MLPTITTTLVQLANLAVIGYAIHSTRVYLLHWLDTRARVGPLVFPARTPAETQLDAERRAA